jgi:NAD(P)H-quinone oxidoreductase subunit 5
MPEHLLSLVALLSPLLFAATALVSWFQPGLQPAAVKKLSIISSLLSIPAAAVCGFFVYRYGLLQSGLIGTDGLGLSIQLDTLSVLMYNMIVLLGFIIIRFSQNYLDGDARQGAFLGRLAATLASVQLLVLAGNLGLLFVAWVLTSISLHRILLFYPERRGAVIAARKKFILARLGDACLLAASIILYQQFGTGNLEVIFQAVQSSISAGMLLPGIEAAALLLVLAALLKSAQFPTHGWLVEVMETPTPVSALLHAGLLNAGPFLIIRMAFVMDASTYAPLLLIAIGGFTALFASVVFLTQTSVKTALGYSSVAHMGFSLMVCGLGVYPAALLHLVAHSFYKAHAFLSSGSVIDVIRASKVAKANRLGSPFRIIAGIMLALGVYIGFSLLLGFDLTADLSLLAVGAIIVMGLSRLFTSAIDSDGSIKLLLRACVLSVVVATAFFTLEGGTHYLMASQLPEPSQPSLIKIGLTGALLILFGITVLLQMLAPAISSKPAYRAWAVHIRNGFYLNALFDRLVGAFSLRTATATSKPLNHTEVPHKSKIQ